MPDVQTLLRQYGDHLEKLAPAISTDELTQLPISPRKPTPRWQRPTFVAASAAVLVLLVIGGLSLVFGGAQEDPADSTVSSSSTVASTVPPTTVPTTPPTTTASLPLPPPPQLGDSVELHPDQVLMAQVFTEVMLSRGVTDRIDFERSDGPDYRATAQGSALGVTLWSFSDADAASQAMADRVAAETDSGLEQPPQVDLGDESVSYGRSVPRVSYDVYLIRIGRLVLEQQKLDEEIDEEVVADVVAAVESEWAPTISAFHEPVPGLETGEPSALPVAYHFSAWFLPVPDGEGGDKAAFTFGYENDGAGSCTAWFGDVEPLDYLTYTRAGDAIKVTHEFFENDRWITEESTVAPDDANYLEAVAECERFSPLAEVWGLGDLVTPPIPEYWASFEVYQSGQDDFVLVDEYLWNTDNELRGDFDQLTYFDRPASVVVTESDILTDGPFVTIGVELEGQRTVFEDMFGIDLSAMPNERIGVGFSLGD